MQKIPIFISSDDNYSPYLATCIASICHNTKEYVDCYVLDGGITESNLSKINNLTKKFKNLAINFIKIDLQKEFDSIDCKIGAEYITMSAYNRFLIPKLKPDLKKAIYIDADTILLNDIASLYNEDISPYTIGAIWNPGREYYNNDTKVPMEMSNNFKYFNSGVLLIDIEKWNQENTLFELFEIEKKYKNVILHGDETILNKHFDEKYKILSLKYNYTEWDNTFNEKIQDVCIWHFITKLKPWMVPENYNSPYYHKIKEFWYYAKMTDFYAEMITKTKDTKEIDHALYLLRVENLIFKANIEKAKRQKCNA